MRADGGADAGRRRPTQGAASPRALNAIHAERREEACERAPRRYREDLTITETSVQARRTRTAQALADQQFDLVVIGGGITGASTARDAALRGYRVALIEQDDFGWGTSSRSSRLIHGGLRYLEEGDLWLVFESLSERATLAKVARHLVRPMPFIYPIYRRQGWGSLAINVGLWLYDGLALFRNYRNHQRLGREDVLAAMPGLLGEGLADGVLYYDYQTNDARLVLENVLSAAEAGATVLSYCRVEQLDCDRQRVVAAIARDRLTGQLVRVSGHLFVCAAGPWTDRVLSLTENKECWLRPTKGVHAVLPKEKLPVEQALVMRHPRDGRVHFLIPYHERTVIGTTDTDFSGDPADVGITAKDIAYLIESAQHHFPEAGIVADDVISAWAGVRPLLAQMDAHSPSAVSREHRIDLRADRILVVAGGKLTTYRRMAAEVLAHAAPVIAAAGGSTPHRGRHSTRTTLPGAVGLKTEAQLEALTRELGEAFGGDVAVAQHLASNYGVRAREIVALAAAEPTLAQRMIAALPFIWAEVRFGVRQELALTIADLLIRRTDVFYRALDQGLGVAERVAAMMGEDLEWDDGERQRQVDAYAAEVAQNRAWRQAEGSP